MVQRQLHKICGVEEILLDACVLMLIIIKGNIWVTVLGRGGGGIFIFGDGLWGREV